MSFALRALALPATILFVACDLNLEAVRALDEGGVNTSTTGDGGIVVGGDGGAPGDASAATQEFIPSLTGFCKTVVMKFCDDFDDAAPLPRNWSLIDAVSGGAVKVQGGTLVATTTALIASRGALMLNKPTVPPIVRAGTDLRVDAHQAASQAQILSIKIQKEVADFWLTISMNLHGKVGGSDVFVEDGGSPPTLITSIADGQWARLLLTVEPTATSVKVTAAVATSRDLSLRQERQISVPLVVPASSVLKLQAGVDNDAAQPTEVSLDSVTLDYD